MTDKFDNKTDLETLYLSIGVKDQINLRYIAQFVGICAVRNHLVLKHPTNLQKNDYQSEF